MSKYLKKLLFWIFIILVIVACGYLGVITYNDANCTRGKNYIVSKYVVNEKDIKGIKYQEYIYEDIANCDSLWLKKCTSNKDLVYEYTLEINDVSVIVKEYKDGSFEDDYTKGEIKDNYLKEKEKTTNEELVESN